MTSAQLSAGQTARSVEWPAEQRFILRAVDWPTYRVLSDALRGRHVRLTYDGENLEFMTISGTHGNFSRLLARLLFVLTEELGLPIRSFGDMTCDREDLARGLEADEWFYIQNEPRIRNHTEVDLTNDPPPDLAIEIDVSRNSRNRLPIYAALNIPEVWIFDGISLRVYVLGPGAQYLLAEHSPIFPQLAPGDLVPFLLRRTETDENSLVRTFREWVREQIARGWQPS